MTTLLTGATGFIGSAVLRRLLAAGHDVRVLVRPGGDRRNLAGLPIDIVEGDLCDAASLQRAVIGCRALFHVAADYRLWVPDPAAMYRANVEGTRTLMQAAQAAGVEVVVYTSSVATLGVNTTGRPADETTPVSIAAMVGPYKRSKFVAEQVVREMIVQGLPAIIVNPSMPVGPRDIKPTPTGRVIIDAARGRIPVYVETGLNVVHVDDVADGHLRALQHGRVGEKYILGGDDMSFRQLLITIAGLSGRRPPLFRLPHAAALPIAHAAESWARLTGRQPLASVDEVRMARKLMFFSSSKAAQELGYRARPATEALADALAWFASAGYFPSTRAA
ncbi:MAG TPA: hopanoid-associated sugar epimerase [Dongiaceae bacterium]|jgi:dihydroflavonol-4-reductase|nr:hopanoid-associated sugar epimerase [Dongiaceae bacterium]